MLEQKQCECGTGFYTAKKQSVICRACRRTARAQTARLRRRAREAQAIGSHNRQQFLGVIRKQQYSCFWCCTSLRDASGKLKATEDHLVPLSRGGGDSIHNIAAACQVCNAEKGDMTAGEYRVFLNASNRRISEVSAVPASTEWVVFEEKPRELCIADLPQELRSGFCELLATHRIVSAPQVFAARRRELKTQAQRILVTEPATLVFLGVDLERKSSRRQELKDQVEQWKARA